MAVPLEHVIGTFAFGGLPYPKLIDRLIALAIERHRAKQETRYTR